MATKHYALKFEDTRDKVTGYSPYNLSFDFIHLWGISSIKEVVFEDAENEIKNYIQNLNTSVRRNETYQEFVDRYLNKQLRQRLHRKNMYLEQCRNTPFLNSFLIKNEVFNMITNSSIQGFTQQFSQTRGLNVPHVDEILGVQLNDWDIFVFSIVSIDDQSIYKDGRTAAIVTGNCGVSVKVTYNPKFLGAEFIELVKKTIDEKYASLYGN